MTENKNTNFHADHCENCFNFSRCTDEDLILRCPIVSCVNENCPLLMHECKLRDHLVICEESELPCINAVNGCEVVLQNRHRGAHLETCNASVVVCSQMYTRKVVKECAQYDSFEENLRNRGKSLNCECFYNDLFLHHLDTWRSLVAEEEESDVAERESVSFNQSVEVRSGNDVPKKCFKCANLGITCMYDLERMNKKPFWVEARGHFIQKSVQREQRLGMRISPEVHGGNFPFKHRVKKKIAEDSALSSSSYRKGLDHGTFFDCAAILRRDEYAAHSLFKHNLIFEKQSRRCPFWHLGCPETFSLLNENYMHKLCFESKTVKLKLRPARDLQEQSDSSKEKPGLLNIPDDLLLDLCGFLDSASLKSLSQCCQQLRWTVLDYCAVFNRAMVVSHWTMSKQKNGRKSWICRFNNRGRNDAEQNAVDLLISDECFRGLEKDSNHRKPFEYPLDSEYKALVTPVSEIGRLCNYKCVRSAEFERHLKTCSHAGPRCDYKDLFNYNDGKVHLPVK